MCGIVGYTGKQNAAPVLLNGLSKLEYRGYDSAGLAFWSDEKITVLKAKGRISELKNLYDNHTRISSFTGIGHTRWATHGEPSYSNAHPHLSRSGRFAVVHNGIIENYLEIKQILLEKGFNFVSQTDTEVVAHLLEYYYKGDILDAVISLQNRLEGSYALGILSCERPGEIVAVRKDSPLVIGVCGDGTVLASDAAALLEYTRDFYEISDKEIAVLSPSGLIFYDSDKEAKTKSTYHVDWDIDSASLGGYEHYMIKEIFEQPKALKDTLQPRIRNGEVVFESLNLTKEQIQGFDKVYITACGSAYHAGVIGKYVIEKLARISVECLLASEFRYQEPIISPKTLVIIISQSGETVDSLAALRYAKTMGAKTLAIVNIVGSAIAKSADYCLYTNAGPEIAVATTKAYSCQLAVLYLLAVMFGRKTGRIDDERNLQLINEISTLPAKAAEVLDQKDIVQYFASKHFNAKNIFFIGRNVDYAAAMEASLKLKEISYIHSEAYAAGELKHGTIALIENGTLVVALAAAEKMFDKLFSNIQEVKARGATVLGLTWSGNKRINDACDSAFFMPKTLDLFTPSLTIIPLQLFAYYVASMRGLDIDKPRNLAKSVTVE